MKNGEKGIKVDGMPQAAGGGDGFGRPELCVGDRWLCWENEEEK